MRAGRALVVLAALGMSGAASAESLVNRVGDAVDTWATGALLEAYGGSRPMLIRGTDISKTVVKAGRIIKWGGLIGLGAGLVNDSLNWYYNQAQNAANGDALGNWWNPGKSVYLEPIPWNDTIPYELVCVSSSITVWVGKTDNPNRWAGLKRSNSPDSPWGTSPVISIYGTLAEVRAFMPPYCQNGKTLAELASTNPSVMSQLRQIVADYLRSHPDIAYSKLSPSPNQNQKDDAVTDPGLDTDLDGQTDGDETRSGLTTNPGNRPHPGDGAPSDPNESSSKAPDTDGDGIPDWRDGDDDNDGTPDIDEPTAPADCQKSRECNPETERDTDGDGTPDREDLDDDNDGFPDSVEEAEGSDPKDKDDKPTDKPCPAGQVRGAGGSCEPEPEPEECLPGQVAGEGGKCEPEKDPAKCPEGQKLDASEPPKCVPDLDPKDPVDDSCGTFGIKRLLTHTGHYLRDVVFPCESDYGWIDEIRQAASTKFPFSLTSSLGNVVNYSGTSDRSAALPDKLGPFNLDWSWLVPLITVVGLLFKGFIGWIAIDILLSRLSGQVVIK